MERQVGRIIAVLHKKPFPAEMFSVRARHENRVRLASCIDIVVAFPVLQLHVARIVQVHLSVLNICASGVNAAAVKGLIRIKHNAFIFPVDHIPARIMPPHLHAAFRIKWRVLEKRVEYAAELTQSIGIVQPAHRRHQVKLLPKASLFDGRLFCRFSQFFQIIRQCAHNIISCLPRTGRADPPSDPAAGPQTVSMPLFIFQSP